MPDICDHVDVDGFGEILDGSDAPSGGGHLRDDDDLHSTKDQLAEAKMFLEAYARELKRTRAEVHQMAQHNDDLKQRLKEAEQRHENELSTVRKELQDAKDLASVSSNKFVDAGAFPTTDDAFSTSEIIEKVNNLNEEIFQAAALLGEAIVHRPPDISQKEMNQALRIAQGMIDYKLINILRHQSRKEVLEANPFLVQVVLQVFLVTYCGHLVQSWSNDMIYHNYLAAIYSKVRDGEEQAISARWRSVTRSYTRPTPEAWREDLLRTLCCVQGVASWATPGVHERAAFEQKLEPIFRAVEDLRDALGEKFTSADLEVFVVDAGQYFQPACMNDAYGDPDRKHPEKHPEVVVGTTGIGLKKAMLKRSAKGEVLYESLLSANVVLESVLSEALQPLPPTDKRKEKRPAPIEKEVLLPLPKQAAGTGTSKISFYPSSATPAARRAAAGPPLPPASPSKADRNPVKLIQPQQQRGTPPESPGGGAGARSGPQQSGLQRKLNRQQNQRQPPLKPHGGNAGDGRDPATGTNTVMR